MIKYQLICGNSHDFEGWFASSKAFEDQKAGGLLCCPHCGTVKVERALMAPNLASPKTRGSQTGPMRDVEREQRQQDEGTREVAHAGPSGAKGEQMHELMMRMRALQNKIRSECRDAGDDFATEARRMHRGEIEHEGIYGNATRQEREELEDEGIEIMSMPWLPRDN